jgi:hypothetical protein
MYETKKGINSFFNTLKKELYPDILDPLKRKVNVYQTKREETARFNAPKTGYNWL